MRGEANTPPPALEYLLGWFQDLSYDRERGMGLGYIKSSEMLAWSRLNSVEISPIEARILKAIDREFVLHYSPPAADALIGDEAPSIMTSLKEIAAQRGRA